MNAGPNSLAAGSQSALARLKSIRGEPLFIAVWDHAVFIHYAVEPSLLQKEVPFPLELWKGKAYVSTVAFTMRGLRLRCGGVLGRWVCLPIATHEFLNVRTYVRHANESGIFFLAEWLSNPLSVRLGPITFGLPYRLAEIEYRHDRINDDLCGRVAASDGGDELAYAARAREEMLRHCAAGSLDEFLLERYTAFTASGNRLRLFRVWHEPWRVVGVTVFGLKDLLLRRTWPWFERATCVGGHYSPGVSNVFMGRPHKVSDSARVPMRGAAAVLTGFYDLP